MAAKCAKSFLPLKAKFVAKAFGGKVHDDSTCVAGTAAKPDYYCQVTRGFSDSRLEQLAESLCKDLRMNKGVVCFEDPPIPILCNEDVVGKADYVVSLWYTFYLQDGVKPWELCDIGGNAVYTAYPARKECLVREYQPHELDTTITTTSSDSEGNDATKEPDGESNSSPEKITTTSTTGTPDDVTTDTAKSDGGLSSPLTETATFGVVMGLAADAAIVSIGYAGYLLYFKCNPRAAAA